jgi:hypothetical protein
VARKSCAIKQLQNTSFAGDPNSPLQHPSPILVGDLHKLPLQSVFQASFRFHSETSHWKMANASEWSHSLPTLLFAALLPKLAVVLELIRKAEGTVTPSAKQALLQAVCSFLQRKYLASICDWTDEWFQTRTCSGKGLCEHARRSRSFGWGTGQYNYNAGDVETA